MGVQVNRLPPEFVQLWKIGEESGELEKVSRKLGDVFAESGEFRMTQFCSWLVKLVYFTILIIMAIRIVMMAASLYGGAFSASGL